MVLYLMPSSTTINKYKGQNIDTFKILDLLVNKKNLSFWYEKIYKA